MHRHGEVVDDRDQIRALCRPEVVPTGSADHQGFLISVQQVQRPRLQEAGVASDGVLTLELREFAALNGR